MANQEQLEELRNIRARWQEGNKTLSSPRDAWPYFMYSDYFNVLRKDNIPIDLSNTTLNKDTLGMSIGSIRSEDFDRVNFSGTQFEGLHFVGEDLDAFILRFGNANLERTQFNNCLFCRVDMRKALVQDAHFNDTSFSLTYLSNLDLRSVHFKNVQIKNCDLSGTNFCGVDLGTSKILEIDVKGGDIEGLSVSKETILPKQPPEWLKQLHDVASREGGTGYAVWRDGKAVECAEPQTQFDTNEIEVTSPVKKKALGS